jgi:hypothetical protein
MKYVYTPIIVLSLTLLPGFSYAADHATSRMIPVAEYLQMEIKSFSAYVQEPGRTNEELSKAISDFMIVLSAYARSLE